MDVASRVEAGSQQESWIGLRSASREPADSSLIPRDRVTLGSDAPVEGIAPEIRAAWGGLAARAVPSPDAWAVLADFPPYRDLQADRVLDGQFRQYMDWMVSLGIPDATYLNPHREERGIHFTSALLHEKVEFQQWLALGHPVADIMDVEYYRAHYEQVYPIAHSRAVTGEVGLLHEYARRRDLPEAPSLAYVLMSPMSEDRGVPVARLMGRLRYNPEIAGQAVTRADLEAAARLFEDGGFVYPDRAAHVEEALRTLPSRG